MMPTHSFLGDDAHLSEEAIALYIDALQANKVHLLPGVIVEHVEECKKCKSEIIEALSLVEEPLHRPAEPHPYLDTIVAPASVRFSFYYRIAAIFLVGISIGVIFYFFRSVHNGETVLSDSKVSMQTARRDTSKGSISDDERIKRRELFADNFSESPNLENLVNAVSRSESPFVVSPKNNDVVSQDILFRWKMHDAGLITITILSNSENVVRSVSLEQSTFLFSEKLDPGLYYWKLERKGDLLYVGKFFVK